MEKFKVSLRICFIRNAFYPFSDISLGKTYIIEISKILVQRGHTVFWLVNTFNEKFKLYDFGGIKVYAVPATYGKGAFAYFLSIGLKILKLFEIVKQGIHIFHVIGTLEGFFGILLKLIFNVKIIYDVRFPEIENWKGKGLWIRALAGQILRKLAGITADSVIAISNGIKKILINNGIPKNKIIGIIPSGVNVDLFKADTTDLALRKRYEFDNSANIIYSGSIDKERHLDILLNAIKLVKEQIPSVRLFMVGEGSARKNLETLSKKLDIEDNIIFTGFVPYEEVPKYINISDIAIVLLPSTLVYEVSSPLKLFEYMACEKAVIATRIKAHTSVIADGKNGLLVNAGDPHDLAKAIKKLHNDKQLSKQIAFNARQYVTKYSSWKTIADKIEEIYRKIA